jgi:hypothetical protein
MGDDIKVLWDYWSKGGLVKQLRINEASAD